MNPCHGYRIDLRDLRYPLGCAALGLFFFFLFIYLCVLSLFMEILPFSLPSSLNVPGAYPGRPSGAGFELIACTGAMGYCSGRGSNQRSPSPRARVIPLPLGYRNFLLFFFFFLLLLLFCNFYL